MQKKESMCNHKNTILKELAADEHLQWSGQPRQGFFIRQDELIAVPHGLIVGVAAFAFVYNAYLNNVENIINVWGYLIILVGLYVMFGRYFHAIKKRKHIFYGVTNKRVIIISGIIFISTNSLILGDLSHIELKNNKNGYDDILLEPEGPMFVLRGYNDKPPVGFYDIENAEHVYKLITGIKENASNKAIQQ